MKTLSIIITVYNQQNLVLRCLDSIPVRDDIEVIVVDDGSTDNTWNNLLKYQEKSQLDLALLYNDVNKGVASAINKGIDNAGGKYITFCGSDDFFYTDRLSYLIDCNYDTDLVYYDLITNEGARFHLEPETKMSYCGSTKFISKNFLGDLREDETKKAGEDYYFYLELLKKNPTEAFSGVACKHYNFPREGSLSWQMRNGLL